MVTSDHELKRTTRYPDLTLTSRPRDMGKVETLMVATSSLLAWMNTPTVVRCESCG